MPVFEYAGVNAEGQSVKGFAHGDSLEGVAKNLVAQGVTIHQISFAAGIDDTPAPPPVQTPRPDSRRTAEPPPPTDPRGMFETKVSGQLVGQVPLTALQFFFSQFATLLDAGINPADALETLTRQTQSPKLVSILREAKNHVIAGRPVSAGLQRYPEVFTPMMMSMVRVGEEGGFMSDQYKQLSEYVKRDIELRNAIKRATAMPLITVVASILIILGTNILIQAIAPGGIMLPTPWIVWILALIIGVGSFLFVKLALPHPNVRRSFDDFVLKLPGLGGMVHGFAMAKFGRAFGAMYKGGVDLPRAVKLAADATGNESVRARVQPAALDLEQGRSITDTLTATGAFSPLVLDMSRTGETTGNMDQMLLKMSEYYEEEGAMKAQIAAKIVGVVCFLLVAVYVAYILISFYSAYFGRIGSAGSDSN